MDDEIVIRGRKFSRAEVEKRGAHKAKIVSNVLRWLGLAIFLIGFLPLIPLFEAANSYDSTYFYMLLGIYIYLLIFLLGPHMIIGIVFFGVSFKKRNPLKYGIEDIEQELPPVDKTLVVQVNNQNSRQPDKFDEIIKYKTLLDQGIITQEEFEEKKRELL